ncbi:TetR/AcrR family transcriptional regulator [Sphaerisporangium perillae]|uniref:TetR/AcrR family transcriptional regulator n=1 Tax=Sphaerisporangium perillae TaxID=2935860 RepID=UPI0020100F78|nr:TetR/AcrR family transcriptional regulator [Sphaerisporangium perillae]
MREFDNVTVAEVAEAANVSTKTVFNYFPRKEGLFLDRVPEAVELITRAVRERPESGRPLTALRGLFHRLLREGHPLAGIGEGYHHFWQVILDSPALRARVREAVDELETLLATLLAEATGADPDDFEPRLAAGLFLAGYRAAYVSSARRLMAGESAQEVIRDHAVLLDRAFDAVDRAVTTL